MIIPNILKSTFVTAAAVTLFTACGKQPDASAPAASTQVAAAPAGTRVIEITADDTMKFSVTRIEAAPGDALRIVLKNIGRMPKQAMAHNWVLLTPGTDADVNAYAVAAASAAPTYLPAAKSSQVVAHTGLVGPGESDTLDFRAPQTPGTYPFLCTFPGHFTMMKGTLVVK